MLMDSHRQKKADGGVIEKKMVTFSKVPKKALTKVGEKMSELNKNVMSKVKKSADMMRSMQPKSSGGSCDKKYASHEKAEMRKIRELENMQRHKKSKGGDVWGTVSRGVKDIERGKYDIDKMGGKSAKMVKKALNVEDGMSKDRNNLAMLGLKKGGRAGRKHAAAGAVGKIRKDQY